MSLTGTSLDDNVKTVIQSMKLSEEEARELEWVRQMLMSNGTSRQKNLLDFVYRLGIVNGIDKGYKQGAKSADEFERITQRTLELNEVMMKYLRSMNAFSAKIPPYLNEE